MANLIKETPILRGKVQKCLSAEGWKQAVSEQSIKNLCQVLYRQCNNIFAQWVGFCTRIYNKSLFTGQIFVCIPETPINLRAHGIFNLNGYWFMLTVKQD